MAGAMYGASALASPGASAPASAQASPASVPGASKVPLVAASRCAPGAPPAWYPPLFALKGGGASNGMSPGLTEGLPRGSSVSGAQPSAAAITTRPASEPLVVTERRRGKPLSMSYEGYEIGADPDTARGGHFDSLMVADRLRGPLRGSLHRLQALRPPLVLVH